MHAVPPYTRVEPLVFDDVPYRVEDHADNICHRSGVTGYFMNELPLYERTAAGRWLLHLRGFRQAVRRQAYPQAGWRSRRYRRNLLQGARAKGAQIQDGAEDVAE
ncbi:alpha-D-ribose 1-methylphosphonate 5-phosphate C-P-lyase PhnJ [Rhizobium viscosum]|uniref:alpha-D-ribose 1-methylphosphonate 5-phosphate C-P-lyase PhnJ n=1 Tax=Rhizobium viscosum TaxID=1673 RepID=UPI0035E42D16